MLTHLKKNTKLVYESKTILNEEKLTKLSI